MLHPDHRHESRPGGRDDSSVADPVVPQHVELVAGRGEAPPGGGDSEPTARASWRRRTRSLASDGSTATARRRCCSPRTTRIPSGSSARPTRAPTSRTPSTRSSCTGTPAPSTRRRPAPRPPPTTASRSAPASRSTVRLCLTDAPQADASVRGLRQDARGQAPRGGRVLPILHAGVGERGHRATSCARRSAACSGPSSTTSSTSTCGCASTAWTRSTRRRRSRSGTASGSTCSTTTSSRCRTSGSTRGTPPGISPFTRSRCRGVDPDFAKHQLNLMLKARYQHSNGQLPAYEWNFGDVNPPVHAWATLFQYRIEQAKRGEGDVEFLKRAFGKLADQLHVVGESQGPPGQERVRGRLPRPRQHRRLRPQRRAADRRPPRAGRRHRVDGDVLPEHVRDRVELAAHDPATTTSPTSLPSTSCGSAPP